MDFEFRQSLVNGIESQETSSETCLCPIITHEVAMYCNTLHDDSSKMTMQAKSIEEISQIARSIVAGVLDSRVPLHTFAISELTRGMLHGLMAVGHDISFIAPKAMRALREALEALSMSGKQSEIALRKGLQQTLMDLGMRRVDEDPSIELQKYFKDQHIRFGIA